MVEQTVRVRVNNMVVYTSKLDCGGKWENIQLGLGLIIWLYTPPNWAGVVSNRTDS